MAYNDEKKQEIRAFYETNFIDAKEIAQTFGVPKRTLYDWIAKEGWKQGGALPKTPIDGDELIKDEFASRLTRMREKTSEGIKEALMSEGIGEIIASAAAKRSTDNLLISAMSAEFLDAKATEALLIAKNAFERFANHNIDNPAACQKLVGMSKNLVDAYVQVKTLIYGKNPETIVNIANVHSATKEEIRSMSDKELLRLLSLQKEDSQ